MKVFGDPDSYSTWRPNARTPAVPQFAARMSRSSGPAFWDPRKTTKWEQKKHRSGSRHARTTGSPAESFRTLESTSLMIHYLSIFDQLFCYRGTPTSLNRSDQESDFLHVIRGGSGALGSEFFCWKTILPHLEIISGGSSLHSGFLQSVPSVNKTERDDDRKCVFRRSACTLAYNSWARFHWTNFRFHRPIRSLTTSAVKFLSLARCGEGYLLLSLSLARCCGRGGVLAP